MVGTIGSVGHRATSTQQLAGWKQIHRFYLLGSILGGGTLGLAVGFAAEFLDAALRAAHRSTAMGIPIAALVLALALRDASILRFPLPQRRRQVPMAWKLLPGMWSPFVFGFALGAGVFTHIYLASFFSMWLLAVLSGSAGWSIAAGVAFGVARALPVSLLRRFPHLEIDDVVARLAKHEQALHILSAAVGAAVAALALLLFSSP